MQGLIFAFLDFVSPYGVNLAAGDKPVDECGVHYCPTIFGKISVIVMTSQCNGYTNCITLGKRTQ